MKTITEKCSFRIIADIATLHLDGNTDATRSLGRSFVAEVKRVGGTVMRYDHVPAGRRTNYFPSDDVRLLFDVE